ncbi:MAG: tetraacyldisaccharide 4'-kinase [Pseudomonadota bacterium]
MRPPGFWNSAEPSLAAYALSPFAAIYAAATARRVARPANYNPCAPVICVGNINAGGTGKTPTVLALTALISDGGLRTAIVSRGHGGALKGPIQVDPARHDASDVGDEPLLMSAFAPVVISRNRAAGTELADQIGADVIVMDDGHQNPDIAKTLSLVVVDASVGFGNGRVIPAGPLREPVTTGLDRADALLSIGGSDAQSQFQARWGDRIGIPHLTAHLAPLPTGMQLRELRAVAFAGIGRPEKFFDTLRAEGVELLRTVPLGDHQPLTPALMRRLAHEAEALGAQLITTEKDAVRLPNDVRRKVITVPVRLQFDVPEAITQVLAPVLAQRTAP